MLTPMIPAIHPEVIMAIPFVSVSVELVLLERIRPIVRAITNNANPIIPPISIPLLFDIRTAIYAPKNTDKQETTVLIIPIKSSGNIPPLTNRADISESSSNDTMLPIILPIITDFVIFFEGEVVLFLAIIIPPVILIKYIKAYGNLLQFANILIIF